MFRTFSALILLLPAAAQAAAIDGAQLSLAWVLPFAGMLLSIALLPLFAEKLWHSHHGKVAAFWAAAFLVPFASSFGLAATGAELAFVLLQEYLPFILLLLALYTAGGGVLLVGRLVGTPATNTAILAIGTLLASVMGTTGAAMLLIRPLLRANAGRERKVHVFVFFIFLVGNIGGSLTPIGDPPLYLGFLAGVSFFWPTTHLFWPFALCAVALLGAFYLIDRWAWAREGEHARSHQPTALRLRGTVNIGLIVLVVLGVLMQGYWHPGTVVVLGETLPIERVLAMGLFILITLVSLRLTPGGVRSDNDFGWGAMLEVAKLFAAIFICMGPVLAMLKAGAAGPAAGLVALTTDAAGQPIPWVYFWMTGGLSAFLDNAPTYLVFFNLAGGNAAQLMGAGAPVLMAISCGAVFMGAMTYIGNAPNFMVKAIVEESGTRMPSFFGYVLWACAFLLPLFLLITFIFFV